MLKAEGLHKTYVLKEKKGLFRKQRKEVNAVRGLSLELEPGEIIGLLGINGAGKTTTIKMLSTLLEPTKGKITIDELDGMRDAHQIKSKVNMIAGGERMLYWRLTGRENLQYFGNLYGLTGGRLQERIEFLLDRVELTESGDTPVERYSKGMKQRLQIARGLINDPKYIFLDEPTLGLDAPVAKQLREYVKRLAKEEGKGILLTSHYLGEVEELCGRVYIIEKGKLVLHDTPGNLVTAIGEGETLSLIVEELSDSLRKKLASFVQSLDAFLSVNQMEEGVEISIRSKKDVTAKVLGFLSEAHVPLVKMSIDKPKLEDVILKLARGKTA